MKTEIAIVVDGQYRLTKVDEKTGKVMDSVVEQAEKALSNQAIGQVLSATIKGATTRRAAFTSFAGLLYAHPRLDGFRGTGDRATGKLSAEFKAAVRDVEGTIVSQLIGEGSIKLPKTGNPEENMQAFLSGLRDDKNYSNLKNTTNKYFALVGQNCVTASGFNVPVPVMQAAISDAVDKQEIDKSIAGKLKGIEAVLADMTIDADDVVDSIAACKRILATLEGVAKHYAELATAQRVQPAPQAVEVPTEDVVALGEIALAKAASGVGEASDKPVKAARQVAKGFGAKLEEKRSALV